MFLLNNVDNVISTSIENIYIKILDSIPVDLCRLIEFTPSLRRLCGNSFVFCSKTFRTHPSIISLKVAYPEHKLSLINLLQQMPNLQSLTFRIQNVDEKSAYEDFAIRLRTHFIYPGKIHILSQLMANVERLFVLLKHI